MAVLATVTLRYLDAEGKPASRSYTARDNNPTDAEIQALASAAQALSAWSLIGASVSREIDVSGITSAPEAGSSRQRDASLSYQTSVLRASRGGKYTFPMPQFKAALLSAAGEIDPADPLFNAWTEQFDDGSGIPAVVGNFFAGNQQELVEDSDPLEGFQNND